MSIGSRNEFEMIGHETSESTKGKIFCHTDLAMCICAPSYWTMLEVEQFANQESPLESFKRWFVDEDIQFYDGQQNPCPCNEHPEDRRHWLLLS